MDRIERMRLFTRVVERGGFAAAAGDLGLARSTATEAIKQLEADLGARLLDRTTRHVAPTLDGEAYYRRCVQILDDLQEAEEGFRSPEPRGLLRVDAHVLLTRTFLLPRLPDFLARYPGIDLQLGQGDRLVDLVREGVDCVLRAGELRDSGMIVRRLALIREATAASPAYLASRGIPTSLEELTGHLMVGFISSRSGEVMPLEFATPAGRRELRLESRVTVNNSDTMTDLALLGYGLMQAPRYRLEPYFRTGELVEVLPGNPPGATPLSALYPQNRQLSARVRVFLDWVIDIFKSGEI